MKPCRGSALLAAILLGAAPPPVASVRLNQVGFETHGPKLAIVPAAAGRHWRVVDANGTTVISGAARSFGFDPASGERVARVDFSSLERAGTGYRVVVGAATSAPFAIEAHPYRRLARAALDFFYQQRSGVPIMADRVERPDLARPAGHPHEEVTCFSGEDAQGRRWPGCDYRLDVTGGWYDAGDQGKYVVNGGISAWTLLDAAARAELAGGALAPLLREEARVEVAFLIGMQIPAGRRIALPDANGRFVATDAGGLVHAKVADERWTPIPTAPADDGERRFLYPPTTAATLNLAAAAARAARVWRERDPAFAAGARDAALRAWAAAERHPAVFGPDVTGSGSYGDRRLDDERFWAAAELLAATGDGRFARVVARSAFLSGKPDDLGWGSTALAGIVALADAGSEVPPAIRAAARRRLLATADGYLKEQAHSGYRLPDASTAYAWGSNGALANRALVLGAAWQIDPKPQYRAAMIDVVDYLLGRNPLDRSFVTGFGARPMREPHHRFWAHAADRRYPSPPSGVLSGGPNNTALADPVAHTMAAECARAAQLCWRDDWRAFSLNEVAINWNAPLVWVAAMLDASPDAQRPSSANR